MAEDGINDYGLAKRKAARQLGVSEVEGLPTNDEIETELRTYQAIYQGEELPARLRELRSIALALMRLLCSHSPYLTGSVLDGTAGRHAVIELAVYSDNPKAVEIFLLDQGIQYRSRDRARTQVSGPETVLSFESQGTPVTLAVFNSIAERVHQRNSHSGHAANRAPIAFVEALVKEFQ